MVSNLGQARRNVDSSMMFVGEGDSPKVDFH